jgi:GDP-4-dehydro-6-deoxy-D-mannose reductase
VRLEDRALHQRRAGPLTGRWYDACCPSRSARITTTLLILGAIGFVGRSLLAHGPYEIAGRAVRLVEPDASVGIVDAGAAMVRAARPDCVLHLAAMSHVPQSFRDPRRTLEVNVIGTLNALAAPRRRVPRSHDLRELRRRVRSCRRRRPTGHRSASAAAPQHPCAVSKLAAEALCAQWAIMEGLDVLIARPFNHIGRGHGDLFVVSGFARQLVEIAHGRADPVVEVGGIDMTCDLLDVRDVIAAHFRLIARAAPARPIMRAPAWSSRCAMCSRSCLPSPDTPPPCAASGCIRPAEQRRMRGSSARLTRGTGWSASVDLDDSLRAILFFWENRRCDARP